jgi:hypothetical protein
VPSRGRRRPGVRPFLAVAPVVVLAACGQPAPSGPDDTVAPTVSVPVQPTILPTTPTEEAIDPSAPGDGGLFDASSSLTGVRCAPGAGDVWAFTGTLANPDDQAHTFTVAAFIVKTSDGSDVASKEVDMTLDGGKSAPVTIDDLWTGASAGVECLSGVTVKGQ